MEQWSYETHRDDTWIYGKTYVDGTFVTSWMKLIEQLEYGPRWLEEAQARIPRRASRKPVQKLYV